MLLLAASCRNPTASPAPSASPADGATLEAGMVASGHYTVDIDGVALAYEVRGRGPACIVIPGGPGLDARYLRGEPIERAFTAIYVDLLGTGRSGKLAAADRYSLARDVASIERVRAALGLERVCIVGHSYGGFVALRYAIEVPERIAGLVLYSTAAATDGTWVRAAMANTRWFAREPWFSTARRALDDESAARTPEQLDRAFDGHMPLYFAQWGAHETEFRAAIRRSQLSFEVARRRELAAFDVRRQLAAIRAPTLVVTGARDFMCGPVPARELADAIDGATLVVLPDAGHYAHVEQPAAFGRALADFARRL